MAEKPYSWTQTQEEVTLVFPIAPAIKAKCAPVIAIMHDWLTWLF